MNVTDPHRLEILTEDGVGFSVQLASPLVRGLAVGVDLLVIATIQSILQIAISLLALISPDAVMALSVILNFLLSIGYFIVSELRMGGQTFGKRLLRLRVMDLRARRLTPGQVMIRNLFRTLDMLPLFYFTGGVVSLMSPRFQRVGDVAAGTLVVRLPSDPLPLPPELGERKFNSLRKHPDVEGQILRTCTPADVALLTEALNRRDSLLASHRIEVFRDVADSFKSRIRLPHELDRQLSDEAFLLNVLDTLTRNQRDL